MTQPTAAEAKLVDKNNNPQIGNRQAAEADLTGTAGATYTSTEQDQINNLRVSFNSLLSKLRKHGLIAD